ncbi:hypothetical protein [Mycobacterium sp. 852002-51057_SCH5723018]|uniref:hypothetical protein n=1 Tax=Mycobacterium sp. 852002-51057_SCH5723018 TaxID=1834094 RepID=UPI0007FD8A4D|nr:hypothetical protein [Mycobacterium sp. 852002-51057_SCH5723018]OBG19350.1 hypothetical protein A5764_17110 [Mycobacterium sp. 852002-51057_SCH5723018]
MVITPAEASIVVAATSLFGVVFSLGWNAVQQRRLTELNSHLAEKQEADSKAAQAARLVAKFRDPLLESAFDLQSRLYNTLSKRNTFTWSNDSYYLPSTLFLVGQFFGWVEILRRNMLYSDIADVGEAKQLLVRLRKIQSLFSATSSDYRDQRYIFRVEQRAIGEIMIDDSVAGEGDIAPRTTIGYATFRCRLDDDQFSRWFSRFEAGLKTPPPPDKPDRLRAIQIALIDLLDFLDSEQERFPDYRDRLPGDTELAANPPHHSDTA